MTDVQTCAQGSYNVNLTYMYWFHIICFLDKNCNTRLRMNKSYLDGNRLFLKYMNLPYGYVLSRPAEVPFLYLDNILVYILADSIQVLLVPSKTHK